MATQKIPLNKFKSKFVVATTNAALSSIYDAQRERATILLNVQATNVTNEDQTISMYVSAGGNGTLNFDQLPPAGSKFAIVENFPIPPRDSRSLVAGRVVLRGEDGSYENPDRLIIQASNEGSIHVSLGLLEAVNKD